MQNRYTKPQDEYEDLVAAFKAKNKVVPCPPAAAKGNEMSRATSDHVRKERAEFRKAKRESNDV